MYFVYALKSQKRNYIYVGLTNSLERRMRQHQEQRERTTSPYAPFDLIVAEEYPTRSVAREREKYLKSGAGKEWLKKYRTSH